jgi:hypothetical protein
MWTFSPKVTRGNYPITLATVLNYNMREDKIMNVTMKITEPTEENGTENATFMQNFFQTTLEGDGTEFTTDERIVLIYDLVTDMDSVESNLDALLDDLVGQSGADQRVVKARVLNDILLPAVLSSFRQSFTEKEIYDLHEHLLDNPSLVESLKRFAETGADMSNKVLAELVRLQATLNFESMLDTFVEDIVKGNGTKTDDVPPKNKHDIH